MEFPGGFVVAPETLLRICMASAFFMCQEALLRTPPLKRWVVSSLIKPNQTLDDAQTHALFLQASSRIVGEVFNIVALPLALMVLADPQMWEDRLHSNSMISSLLLQMCAGYFVHDTFVCLSQVRTEGVMYLVHALVCVCIFTYGFVSGRQHLYGAVFILFEASTPFVHMHWYFGKTGRTGTKAYLLNGLAMLVVFVSVRNIFGTAMSIDYFMVTAKELARTDPGALAPSVIWFYRMANLTLNGLNLIWGSKMARGALKALMKQTKGKKAE